MAAPEPEPNDRMSQILEKAAQLFADKGFEAASMRDIAESVGISKPTIYHYFSDKNALYVRIIVTGAERLCRFTEDMVGRKTSPSERFQAFLEGHARFFAENRVFYTAANFGFSGLRDPRARSQVVKWRDQHEANLRKIIVDGVACGEFADVSVPLLSRAVLSSLTGMARWHQAGGALAELEVARGFAEIFLKGALRRAPPPKPRGKSRA